MWGQADLPLVIPPLLTVIDRTLYIQLRLRFSHGTSRNNDIRGQAMYDTVVALKSASIRDTGSLKICKE